MSNGSPSALDRPLIINLAATGAVADLGKNPNVPVTVPRIIEDVAACAMLGVGIAHLHVRDGAGAPSCDPALFSAVIAGLRARRETRDLVLCATTSGRHGQSLEQRCAVLGLPKPVRPEMASLTVGSLNFPSGASVNAPDTIRALAAAMREAEVKPELEIFDLGMIEFAKVLIGEGLVAPPYYFNLILGNIGGLGSTVQHLAFAVTLLPENSIVSVGGIGRSQTEAIAIGIAAGYGVRTGLEDNLWADPKTRRPATNAGLVGHATAIASAIGRPIAGIDQTRAILGLPARLPQG
jgi:3-keto-5-aminohexanoate cleavage enzyme